MFQQKRKILQKCSWKVIDQSIRIGFISFANDDTTNIMLWHENHRLERWCSNSLKLHIYQIFAKDKICVWGVLGKNICTLNRNITYEIEILEHWL